MEFLFSSQVKILSSISGLVSVCGVSKVLNVMLKSVSNGNLVKTSRFPCFKCVLVWYIKV